MKLKSDFVTNSSSVSFCIYGLLFDELPIKVIKYYYEYYKVKHPDKYSNMKYEEFKNNFDVWEIENEDLELYQHPYRDEYYIGKNLSSMKLDQTLREFENEVEKILEKIGFDVDYCGIIEEGWMDN